MPNEMWKLDERAFGAALMAYHRTYLDQYGPLKAAITAYLAAYTSDAERHERAVPDGWQLVPKAMDVKMIGAWYRYKNGWHSHDEPAPADTSDVGAWAALLAAAPPPPAAVQEPVAVKALDALMDQLNVLSGYYITRPPTLDSEFVNVCNGDLRKMTELLAKARSSLSTPQNDPAPEIAAQCCMCGKKDLSIIEGDGGTECELSDGRWTCSIDCYDLATETPMDKGLWRFWNEKAKTYLAERDSLKALCDEMAKALEPFAKLASEFVDEEDFRHKPDDRTVWGFNDHELSYGDFRRGHSLLAAYRKAKEVGNG